MKKIIFAGLYYLDNGGNAALRRAYGLIDLLPKNNVDIKLIGYSKRGNVIVEPTVCKLYNILYSSKLDIYFAFKEMKFVLDSLDLIEGDCLILYNPPAYLLFKITKYSKKKNMRLIVDITEYYSYSFNFIKSIDTFIRMEVLLRFYKKIICVSKYLADKYSKGSNSVEVIPTISGNFNNHGVTKKLCCYENYIFCFAGTISYTKERVDWAIKSFRNLYVNKCISNFFIKIIGCSREDFLKVYPNVGRDLDLLNEKVIFLGRVTNERVKQELVNSHYSLVVRDKNKITQAGSPTKLFESLECGTPAIATPVGDVGYFFSAPECFISQEVSQNSIELLIESVLKMTRDEYLANIDQILNNNSLRVIKEDCSIKFNKIILK